MHLRGRDEAALAMKAVTANVLVAENVSYPICELYQSRIYMFAS